MERLVRAYYVPELDTLDVWFENPALEVESREVGDGVIAKIGRDEGIIGVEIISASKTGPEDLRNLPEQIRGILRDSMRKMAAAASRMT